MSGCDPVALAQSGVRGLTPYQPGKPVEALERELGLTGVIKLASNESPLGPGPRAREAAAATLAGLGRYPDGGGHGLRAALARHLGVAPDAITLGNGSNDVLELLGRAFLGPGREAVYSAHAFAVYPLVTQATGARSVVTPAHDFGHDLEAMAAAVGPETRLVFIANPNNPTGTWLPRDDVARFLAAAPPTALVVVDEAYFEYVEVEGYASALGLLPDHPNLVVTRTFSKAHGLAGLRAGYAVSSPEIADLLNRVRQPFNLNSVALAAAAAALDDEQHLETTRRVNREGLARLAAIARGLDLESIPSVANFLTLRMPRPGREVFEALLREGVIVRPIAEYGLPDHIRVTVGLAAENERFGEALARVLRRSAAA